MIKQWFKGKSSVIILLLTVTLLLPVSTHAFINGSRVLGYGARASGRGGVDIAVADDAFGINTNPAGMSWIDGGMADVNLSILYIDGEMRNPANTDGRPVKTRFLMDPGVGIVYHPKEKKYAFGFSFVAPDALAADYTINANYFNADPLRTGTESTQSASSEWIHLRVSPAVSYAPNDKLSFGARIGIDYMTLDLCAPLGRSYMNLGTADGFGYSFGVGMQYRPTSRLSLGLSAETQSYMQNLTTRSGDTSLLLDVSGMPGFSDGSILSFSGMQAEVSDWESPPIVGAGASYKITDRLSVGVDFKYFFWSETNDVMNIKFSGGDVARLQAITGVDELSIPFKWEDSWAIGLGGDYHVTDWLTARLGYNYGEVVTEENFTNYLCPILFNHHLTLGSSITLNDFVLSLAIIYSFENNESNGSLSGVDQAVMDQLGGLPIDSELNDMNLEATLTTFSLQLSFQF